MERSEFRCVVLGDEPAALWLLQRLATLSAQRGEPMSLAWVSLGKSDRRLCIPSAFAERYSLSVTQPWSAEILTEKEMFSWDPVTLKEKFPSLPQPESDAELLELLIHPSERVRAAYRLAIQKNPQLLTIAKALWKRVGRTGRLAPEQFLIGAMLCRRLNWWVPAGIGFEGERFQIHPRLNPLQKIKTERDGALTLEFEGHPPILGYRWILATDIHDLELLSRKYPGLLDMAFPAEDFEPRAHRGLFPLDLKVPSEVVPCAMRPLTLSFESSNYPDLDRELWAIDNHLPLAPGPTRDLTLWASAFHGLDLDDVLDQFCAGMRHVAHLMPFLPERIQNLSSPLAMESCGSPEGRAAAIDALENRRIEKYDLTRFHTQTRSPAVHALLPNLFCHLPYPLGTFLAAESLVPQILGKPKNKRPTAVSASGPSSPRAEPRA